MSKYKANKVSVRLISQKGNIFSFYCTYIHKYHVKYVLLINFYWIFHNIAYCQGTLSTDKTYLHRTFSWALFFCLLREEKGFICLFSWENEKKQSAYRNIMDILPVDDRESRDRIISWEIQYLPLIPRYTDPHVKRNTSFHLSRTSMRTSSPWLSCNFGSMKGERRQKKNLLFILTTLFEHLYHLWWYNCVLSHHCIAH